MKYRKEDYLAFDIIEGDMGGDVECRTRKIVKTRKEHECHMNPDDDECNGVKKGDMALFDKALCDGMWGALYICLPCIERWFRSIGIYPDQSQFKCKCKNDYTEICGTFEKSEDGDWCETCEHDEACHEVIREVVEGLE